MNFMEAVKAMKEGKKTEFEGNIYYYENGNFYMNEGVPVFRIDIPFEATDWEVVDEAKKTLWDKVCEYEEDDKLFSATNVEKAIQEYVKAVTIITIGSAFMTEAVIDVAEEIFGKELLE